jgi:drug/metabolite transporter (DMT)-like permease
LQKAVNKPSRSSAISLALFVVFLWATSWVFIKLGLAEMPALTFAGLRYTLAFLCLLPVGLLTRKFPAPGKIPRATWVRLLILGVLYYSITQGAIFLALSYLPAVMTNLLWSFSSILVALMGIVWLAERPTGFQWMGIALALCGAFLYFYVPVHISSTSDPSGFAAGRWFGVVISIVGVFANAGASILGREVNRSGRLDPLVVTMISMGFGAVILLVMGLMIQGMPPISLQGWLIIAWLAVANTAFAFALWNHTLRTLTAVESSIINGTMLIWIPVLAVIFLDESISPIELGGIILVGAGTLIVQLRQPPGLRKGIRH